MTANSENIIAIKNDSQEEQDQILLQPYFYILQNPGKQIRTKLAKAFNYWLNVPEDKLVAIGDIVQMLHNASLLNSQMPEDLKNTIFTTILLDDIEDNSKLRRGIPVAHSIFGIASTINAANYACFLGLEKTIQLNHSDATQVYTEQLLELHRGQGMEIYWRDSFTCPLEEDYKKMVIRKTGGLFGLAIRLMQLFSENKSDFSGLTSILGLLFQIRDDLMNMSSDDYTENKGFCEDLTEGKFSFPVIHSIQTHPEDPQVLNILRQRTSNVEIKKYCVNLLEKFGSFEYTRKTLAELYVSAVNEIEKLGGNPRLLKILEELRTGK